MNLTDIESNAHVILKISYITRFERLFTEVAKSKKLVNKILKNITIQIERFQLPAKNLVKSCPIVNICYLFWDFSTVCFEVSISGTFYLIFHVNRLKQ